MPGSHSMQTLAPASEKLPSGQLRHESRDVAARVGEKLPAGQARQSLSWLLPMESAKVPALHSMQSVSALLPVVSANLPAWHKMQSASCDPPVESRYLPVAQSVHTEAALSAYLPSEHSSHAPEPVPALNVPALQAVHACFGLTGADRKEAQGTESSLET